MNILYIAHGGFGDVSFTTSWPRIWAEKGYTVDVFLMLYTGNPFHINPYIRNMFIAPSAQKMEMLNNVLEKHSYDKIIIIENSNDGVKEVIDRIKSLKESMLLNSTEILRKTVLDNTKITPDDISPALATPEWNFSKSEIDFIQHNYPRESILFHPLCSSHAEESRNINFSLVEDCCKLLSNSVIVYGGYRTTIDFTEKIKLIENNGIKILWENYNCFVDNEGSPIGKIMALVSTCKVSVHGYSGSFLLPVGYNKPMVMVVPKDKIRCNAAAPYFESSQLFLQHKNWIKNAGYTGCSAWCVTDKVEDIIEAINLVLSGKSGFFNKRWNFF